ncbi:MAG: hypothetical protein JW862_15565, partial [Anaerolineales bacterium]|nr:hypothetical protein [Anaerolineales bacterium]
MPEQRVLQLEYQQSLSYSSTRPAWSEEVTISVRILSEAITSGWYAENFGKRALDFVVLIALVMHSRPLTGADLALFIQLGLATKSDEGRLYARVTDKGLARELHVDRDTVGACATRLHKHQFITIAQLPEGMDFHDSRGQYAGSKIYLVSGELQNLLQKGISHRAEIFPTVTSFSADRAETFRTADNNPSPHRAENNRIGAENLRINIDDDDSADGEVNGSAAEIPISNIVFMHFSSRKGVTDYNPTNNERDALDGLLKEGFTLEQILGAIDAAFARPSKPRYFTLCANIAHDIARNAARNLPPEARTLGTCQSEANPPETRQPEACQKPENIESELTRAAEIYCSGSRALTQDVVARLRRMAQRCESTAQQAGATGGEWLADAMELALGNAQPESLLNYADTV